MTHLLNSLILQPWNDALTVFWPIVLQGVLVSCALGLLGCFLVVRGMSLLGDALSHAVLPGIALGFLIPAYFGTASLHSPWILVGATIMGLAAAILVETVQKHTRVKEDASLGIVFTTLFALGVILISRYGGQADLDPGCILYGNIESFVSIDGQLPHGVRPMILILGLIILGIAVFYRRLLVSTFDPSLAVSVGISASMMHYGLMTVLSLTIVASFESVGAILSVALLILPGATARLWADRLPRMLWLSVGCGIVTSVGGYWLSHRNVLNTSAGASMVLAGFVLFLVSWIAAPRTGLVTRWLVRRRLRQRIELENLLKTLRELVESDRRVLAEGRIAAQPLVEPQPTAAAATPPSATPPLQSSGVGPAEPAGTTALERGKGPGASPAVGLSRLLRELNWPPRKLEAVLRRAVDRGWIAREGYLIRLTPAGVERAQRLEAAHRAWEGYLQNQLGLPADHVHDGAEWIEHFLEDADVEAVARAP
ncbi:MAG: metal ABC transporter permease [Phycisphaerae bacterium]|nr:metal ABC transporter permease [Phycisphaerae bacterium]